MKSPVHAGLAALALLLGYAADEGRAQGRSAPRSITSSQPTVSPFINLGRGAGVFNPAIDYFGIVRPELNFQTTQQALGQQTAVLQQQVQQLEGLPPGSVVTGVRAQFQNYGRYFQNNRGAAAPSPLVTTRIIQPNRPQLSVIGGGIVPTNISPYGAYPYGAYPYGAGGIR
jgi:hypothetical protein